MILYYLKYFCWLIILISLPGLIFPIILVLLISRGVIKLNLWLIFSFIFTSILFSRSWRNQLLYSGSTVSTGNIDVKMKEASFSPVASPFRNSINAAKKLAARRHSNTNNKLLQWIHMSSNIYKKKKKRHFQLTVRFFHA